MRIIAAATLCLSLVNSGSAGLVVDAAAGFHALTANLEPARPASVDTDVERSYDWSDSAYLYDGVPAGTKLFGGVRITSVSNLTHAGVGTTIQIQSGPNELRASVGNNIAEGGGPSEVRAIYFWDSDDFTESGTLTFTPEGSSSLAITGGTMFDLASRGGVRFVVRDGTTYYVSNISGLDATGTGESGTVTGATPGLEWASFNPTDFATFDEDAAGLGLPSLAGFSPMAFTNVTGAGFIGNALRTSFSRFEIRDFKVNLQTDTSLPGYGSYPFSIVDTEVDTGTGSAALSWESALNQRFNIERSADLAGWTIIASNYPALGADSNRVSYVDPSGIPGEAFYRVQRPYDPNKKLNVLLIVIDDLRDHEAFSLNNIIQMPNLDRLAAKGVKFSNAFCQATFCNPSRASFLTGLRPDTTGIENNTDYFRDSANPAVANAVTMPQCFRSNDYYTVSLGKILHHDQMDPPSWDLQINTFPATPAGNSGEWVNMTADAAAPLDWCRWRAPDCEDNDLGDGIMTEQAVSILQQKRTDPFFMAVGFKKPHDPFDAPKKYFDMYPLTNLVLHVDPVDASPLPPQALAVNGGSMQAFNAMDDQDRLEFLRSYAACSTYVDTQIGKILDAMDELGLWQNTIVMLWTDHGYHQGERGWWNKTLLDTYDAKVPFLAYVPEMTGNSAVSTGVIELVDIYPTLAELTGITAPAALEGESFVPLLENPDIPWSGVGISQKSTGKTVFDGRYRYTEWNDGALQLHDHTTDPGEWYNLAYDSAYSNIIQALSVWLQ